MNVSHIVLATRLIYCCSHYSFLVLDNYFHRPCGLFENFGPSLQTVSKFSLQVEGDMRAKGYFYRIKQHPKIPALNQHFVLYLLSFAAFHPY